MDEGIDEIDYVLQCRMQLSFDEPYPEPIFSAAIRILVAIVC